MINDLFYRNPMAPCKGCSDRTAGCHGNCEGYAAWVKEKEAINDKILSNKTTENLSKETAINSLIKRKKRYAR